MPGPPPKRADQRRRGEKGQSVPLTKAPAGEVISVPPCPEGLHPMAADWYGSLAKSGQSAFYEYSDWAMAQVAAKILSGLLSAVGRPSGQTLQVWLQMSSALLVTEGDRRRLRIELVRDGAVDADADAAKATITTLQKRFSG